jgi:hypothetical protein
MDLNRIAAAPNDWAIFQLEMLDMMSSKTTILSFTYKTEYYRCIKSLYISIVQTSDVMELLDLITEISFDNPRSGVETVVPVPNIPISCSCGCVIFAYCIILLPNQNLLHRKDKALKILAIPY